jgi:hypothetical protein
MNIDQLWGESGVTILVLPSGAQGEQLLQVAREWTSLRLLSPSIWVQPEKLRHEAGAPPQIVATVLASTQAGEVREREVELFHQLAMQQLTSVRMLVTRPAVPDAEFDSIQDEFVTVLSEYLEIATPQILASKETGGEGVTLTKLNLITGPTEHTIGEPERLLSPLFNAHFVASAEDRSGPRTGDAFVRYSPDSSKFAGFTMLHVATLGALWVGIPKGGHELVGQATYEGDSVYVSRVFASAILTDGLVRRAVARVLETAADSRIGIEELGVGLTIPGTYPIQDNDVDAWLDFMVNTTFDFEDGILQYKPVLEAPTPPKTKFGLGGQLVDFFRFAFKKIFRIPVYAWKWFISKLSDLFNDIFQGGDKGASEVVKPEEVSDPSDVELMAKYDEVFAVKQRADQALVSPVGRSTLRSTPSLWEGIRKLVFGFIDGSNLGQFGVAKSDNGWPIFYRVSTIFQDPADQLLVTDPTVDGRSQVFGWGSADETHTFAADLAAKQLVLKEQMSAELSVVVGARQRIEDLGREIEELDAAVSNEDGLTKIGKGSL